MKIEEAYSIKVKQLIDSAQYALSELLKYGLVDDIPELKLNKKKYRKNL